MSGGRRPGRAGPSRHGPLLAVSLLAALALASACPALAKDHPARAASPAGTSGQGAGFNFADQKSGSPLEIYADQGLELSQDAKMVIGRTNARAVRGNVTVKGDVLIAHYRDKQPAPGQPAPAAVPKPAAAGPDAKSSSSEVWRVEATGHVTISTPTETVYGDHADYNIDQAVVVVTGKDLRLVTPTDSVTARDSLEYWEHRQQAVARGNAVAVRADKRLQGDILVADFGRNSQNQMVMQKAHAYDHVILTTPREIVTGDRADDNVETGIVTVTGSVKITRDEDQLDGGYAVVNLNTGISRIFPAAPGAAQPDQRVKGLFVPQRKKNATGATGEPAATTPSPASQAPR